MLKKERRPATPMSPGTASLGKWRFHEDPGEREKHILSVFLKEP